MLFLPQGRGGGVVGDAVNPGGETAVFLKRGKVGEGFHKTVLRQLFRILRRAYHADNQMKHLRSVGFQKVGELFGSPA